jgi:hypothetical protein
MSGQLRILVVAAGAALALIALGRYESASASRAQVHGMQRVFALVGPHWATTPTAYRLSFAFDCLLYRVGSNPYALELCFDAGGRVVEAIDRRGTSPRFYTLRYDPGASTLRVEPRTLTAAFVAARAAPRGSTSIPLGQFDSGPTLIKRATTKR